MSFLPTWSTCNALPGGAATQWSHIYAMEDPYTWSCYYFESKRTGIAMNSVIAIGLLIAKCDAMQAQIDAGGGGVDMPTILSAMWDGNKIESFMFVNYIDAMRASIWNTEIYESHLESWYHHFMYET